MAQLLQYILQVYPIKWSLSEYTVYVCIFQIHDILFNPFANLHIYIVILLIILKESGVRKYRDCLCVCVIACSVFKCYNPVK